MSHGIVELMVRVSTTAGSMALIFVIFCLTEVTRARLSQEYGEMLTRMFLAARHLMGIIMGGFAVFALLTNAGMGMYLIQQGLIPLENVYLQVILSVTFFFGLGNLVLTTFFLTVFEIIALPRAIRELEEVLYD